MTKPFVHLHVHTAHSLSEGAIQLGDLAEICRSNGMPAVAMTDTANMSGAVEFSKAAATAGIQPIFGVELTLADAIVTSGPCVSPEPVPVRGIVVAIAKDEEGWSNLVRLSSAAHLQSAQGDAPSVRLEDLDRFSAGVLLLTGGPRGPVDALLRSQRAAAASSLIDVLAGMFGDRLYVEIQRQSGCLDRRVEADLVQMADDLGLPLVATNEAYFATPDMHEAHDALLCIAEGSHLTTAERRRVSPDAWLKSGDDMAELFADMPDAIENTLAVARRCSFVLRKKSPALPSFPGLADGRNEADELSAQASAGLESRLDAMSVAEPARAAYRERLAFEVDVITRMGFSGYFLIVADFIGWARSAGIPVGPGRGSGAGSVVAWALRITGLDPIQHGLLFERFLNPDRVSMPDFDIDFSQERRDEVIAYVRRRYGEDRVCQIATFGTLQARAVVRDVGRVLQVPFPVVNRFCSLIPNNPADPVSLEKAMQMEPLSDELARAEPQIRRLFSLALKLEGLYRHASKHAAGVVIADRPVAEVVPVMRDPHGEVITQYGMKAVEEAGLVKFDLLGLKTLDVLSGAAAMLKASGEAVDLDALPEDDAATYAMMSKGDSFGVFQLESAGMRQALRMLRPNRFADIVALVSLYRPGPMDNIPTYVRVKDGRLAPDYMHPLLKPILEETNGIMIYQEQVMQAAQVLAGYSLGGADLLRRAMGKKIQEEMDRQRAVFVEGAVGNGVPAAQAGHIFDQIDKFAGYGFNKSHAAAYALIAYQTAWLKANHPVEFVASSMNLDIGEVEKIAAWHAFAQEARIRIKAPDVNRSWARFTVERDGRGKTVRWGLAAIRGLGVEAMEQLISERKARGPFRNLDDLVRRTVAFKLSRKVFESLVRSGALDGFGESRAGLLAQIDRTLKEAQTDVRRKATGQGSFFDDLLAVPASAKPVPAPEMPRGSLLRGEWETLGIYLSGHPLDTMRADLARDKALSIRTVKDGTRSYRAPVRIGAILARMEVKSTRKREPMAVLSLSDPTGSAEAIALAGDYERIASLLREGEAYVLTVGVAERDGERRLFVRDIEPLAMSEAA